jgi:hypothetical protein
MLGSIVLDVVLGLVFVYWFFGSICSAAVEILAARSEARGALLRASMQELLGDLGKSVLDHALVKPAGKDAPKACYISRDLFAGVLRDCARQANQGELPRTRAEMEAVIGTIHDPQLQGLLRGWLDAAGAEATAAEQRVNQWFDHAMSGLTDSYRRQSRKWAFAAALLISVGCNVDTLYIAEALWANPVVSAQIAEVAQDAARTAPGADPDMKKRVVEMAALHRRVELPVGWTRSERARYAHAGAGDRALKALGLLVTTFALTLGAPFWFEILKRLAGLRRPPQAEKA